MTVVLHEINHGFQKTAPRDYREFRDYAVQAITRLTKGAAQSSIAEQYQKRYGGISKDKAMDEIAADFTEYILTDEATLRQFINDHVNDKNKRNVAQRFFDSVRNFINKVKNIFKGNKAAMDEAAVNEFGATVAELEKAEKLWKDTLKATQEKTNEAKQGKISEVSVDAGNTHDVKYLIKQSSEHGLIAVLDKKIVPLDGETENQAIKRFFSENIKGKEAHIISSDEKAQFDQIGKYLYPGKPIANMNVKKDATAILIDMVSVGTNKRHSEDLFINGKKKNHSGLDATNGWDYYGTKFIIDESGTVWSGLLIIRKSKNNRDYFYDLDLIKKAGHQDVSKLLNPVRAAAYDYSKTQMTDDVKRFSLKKPVEETKNLLALHNLTEENLSDALKLGGLPMPSIAVVKKDMGHSKYGPISLVFDKNTIDPQSDSRNKVYGGDGYTPTAPSVEYPVNYDTLRKFEKTISDLSKKVGGGVFSNDSALRRIGVEDVTDMSLNDIANRLSSDDSVRNFINKVKSVFKGNKTAMDEAAVNEFGATVAELEKAEKLWKDTLKVVQEKTNEAKQGKVETTEVADNTNEQKAKAKGKVAGELGLLIETATNRRWEETKHTHNKDAKYGIYRYDSRFAFPVKDNSENIINVRAYDVELVIINASDRKEYLYDIVNIKENTANANILLQRENRLVAHNAAKRNSVSENNITKDKSDVKFSLKKPVEETKNLLALHNLTVENLSDALKLGGLPMPSVAGVNYLHCKVENL